MGIWMKGTGGRECATAKKVEINLLYLKKDKNIKCVWGTVSESTESGTQKVTY